MLEGSGEPRPRQQGQRRGHPGCSTAGAGGDPCNAAHLPTTARPGQLPRRARGRHVLRVHVRCGLQLPACHAAHARLPSAACRRGRDPHPAGRTGGARQCRPSSADGPSLALLPPLACAAYGCPTRNFLFLFDTWGCGRPPRP